MGQLVVRNVDDAALARLKHRAKQAGISLEELIRQLLRDASRPSRDELLAQMDRIAGMTPRRTKKPVAHLLIREGREER